MRTFLLLFFVCAPLLRGEESTATQWALSTGWDSLYMFRGSNQLPGFDGYGSGISWTGLSLTADLTDADALALGTWSAFGISESDYKEADVFAVYSHSAGNFTVALGYSLYAVLSETNGLYANELNVSAGYEFDIGGIVLTPGVEYAFNLGPAPGNRGYVEQASSYLELRIDGDVALYGDAVHLAPWTALGVNFRYNTTSRDDPPSPFTGADHVEAGISLPIAPSRSITLAPYAATSWQWAGLPGTRPATFWGGASVTFSF